MQLIIIWLSMHALITVMKDNMSETSILPEMEKHQ